ncbi:MAG: hypothetical protein A3D44_04055 [Candidatus Staskawiczbacteria bacterium RIFCSPHIGHO2_02_FULL_42_22]|uniref:Uncharacterized protein n=1 Tax=Candidatus Staskawiczbacteria bacterium RIFCSPHIGHO2_02_FULL_42_22 TaxID=1802207 RepID=A0A1G2I1V4_9BACT|nr:MAG: hypothetical protein A3D44_04055 [Candidatus Staskawiczbacteria bacterium RIFCSPHIGHO2_02_FULL_42_22]
MNREDILQRIASQIDEVKKLELALGKLNSKRNQLSKDYEEKKNLLERICGASWEDLWSAMDVAQKPEDSSDSEPKKVPEPKRAQTQKPRQSKRLLVAKDSVAYWILSAIDHYERNNPDSRTDVESIKIFIDSTKPDFLPHHSPNSVAWTVYNLTLRRMITRTRGRSGKNKKSQYHLTDLGKQALLVHQQGGEQ